MFKPARRFCSLTLYTVGALLLGAVFSPRAWATDRTVGQGKMYSTVRAAAQACQSGDTVTVDAGTYRNDVCTWNQPNLLVRAASGALTRPHLIANGSSENDMGVWRVSQSGTNITFDGFEIEGGYSTYANGAAIRVESGNPSTITIRNCYFHDCQMEILAAPQTLIVENTELFHSTHTTVGCEAAPTCYEHCIYVNTSYCQSATIRYCYIHQADTGNEIKSRAQNTSILYNRIADENAIPSYTIDIPDGGRSYVIGNIIAQGVNSPNTSVLSYAAESAGNGNLDLYVINNTFVNELSGGTYINARSGTVGKVFNNIFYGPGTLTAGGLFVMSGNYQDTQRNNGPMFVNPGPPSYDYHLTSASPSSILNAAIGAGTSVTGTLLTPGQQYVYDLQSTPRSLLGALDLGAFEYTGGGGPGPDVTAPSSIRDLRNR